MRVFIAGGSGVLGRSLIPLLLAAGHRVRGLARTERSARILAALGAEPVPGDLLDPETALGPVVAGCDGVIHIATAIPANAQAVGAWEATARLRVEGTVRLVAASLDAGVSRYVGQSITMAYPDRGDEWIDERTPLDVLSRPNIAGPVAAMEARIRAVPTGRLGWCILRGAAFVGPGTAQDALVARLLAGEATVPGTGRAFVSLVHVGDMAGAAALALARAPAGSILNVAHQPLRVAHYMDELSGRVGAPVPRREATGAEAPSWRCDSQALRRLGWRPGRGIWPQL